VTMSGWASTSLGNQSQPGSEVIRGCARGSNWSQTRRSGPRKRAAFDEAVRGDGPGTSSLGGESNPVNPSAGSATEGVRGKCTTFAPGRQRREEGGCSEGSRSRARRAEQAELPGKPGTIVELMPKLEARRQTKLHSIMLSPRFLPGERCGSCHQRRKPMEAVIRGPNDPWSARVVSRLQTLGRRIFPGVTKRAARFAESPAVSACRGCGMPPRLAEGGA
jgi:hypothetical protein